MQHCTTIKQTNLKLNMPCSRCGKDGHNIKTCSGRTPRTLPRQTKREVKDCCVCYEPLESGNGTVTTNCGHNYCAPCFASWMRKSGNCAYCRDEVCEKPQTFARFTEAQEEQILDECLINTELCGAIVADLKKQFVAGMRARNMLRGYCHPKDIVDILDEISLVYSMSVVGHDVLDLIAMNYNLT